MQSSVACDLLIVGGEGDLALRKLYPALYSLWLSKCLPKDFRIIAVSRREASQAEFFEQVRPNTRIVVEKPLGADRESFLAINSQLTGIFEERQVYRIDHYLGKETVQNLLALRFANMFLEPLWNGKYIDNVQITVAESLGVTGRWEFNDSAGAMRDMLQNHLLQLLCLTAMEPEMISDNIVLGQYQAGTAGGKAVPGYCEEEDAQPRSSTETFVAIKAHIDNWRWAGVPFYLRTGKRLHAQFSEIVVEFKPVPHSIYPEQRVMNAPNRLIIRLQPDETISLELMNKVAGLDVKTSLRTATLGLSFPEENEPGATPDAYQRRRADCAR
jgi:glucose-6-phosphate 1-dehydrogenase